MITINSVSKLNTSANVSREVKIVQFDDPPPTSLTPSWISELRPKKLKENEWNPKLSRVIVRDVVTNEIFKVAESQLKWVVTGESKKKNQEAVLFVKRRYV